MIKYTSTLTNFPGNITLQTVKGRQDHTKNMPGTSRLEDDPLYQVSLQSVTNFESTSLPQALRGRPTNKPILQLYTPLTLCLQEHLYRLMVAQPPMKKKSAG